MIFLVGARRSGTNWLQRILCTHPDVAGIASETYLFRHGIQQLSERFHQSAPGSTSTGFVYMEREAMLDALREFCDRVFLGVIAATAPGAVRMIERTPDHVRHLPLIGQIYPDARVVHIVRDGRDVARSLLNQTWGPSTMEEAAEEWRSAIEAARAAAPGLAHYREVRYEAFHADPERELGALASWLGLSFSPADIEASLSEAGIRFNVDPAAPRMGAGKWRDALPDEDLATFMRIAGPALSAAGYEDAAPEPSPGRSTAPPAPGPRRSLAPLRRALRRTPSKEKGAFEREAVLRARRSQAILDQALACLGSQRFDSLIDLMHSDAYVRVVAPPEEWEGRGPAAFTRLVEHLSGDRALRGRTLRGDIHPGVPTSTAIMSYRLADGSTQDRMVSASVESLRIARLTYYRLPLDPDGRDA
jgi:hypothetical protein